MRITRDWVNKAPLLRLFAITCAIVVIAFIPPGVAYADTESNAVRVGYYENEVFQEGAREGAVKTGYAYEYYRKISEYPTD